MHSVLIGVFLREKVSCVRQVVVNVKSNRNYSTRIDSEKGLKVTILYVLHIRVCGHSRDLVDIPHKCKDVGIFSHTFLVHFEECKVPKHSNQYKKKKLIPLHWIKTEKGGEESNICFCQLIPTEVSTVLEYSLNLVQEFKESSHQLVVFLLFFLKVRILLNIEGQFT